MKRAALTGVTAAIAVALAACTVARESRPSSSATPRATSVTYTVGTPAPIEFCGQKLTKPVQTAEGRQSVGRNHLPHVVAPEHSVLPARIASDSPTLSNWSNLLILSRRCSRGYTVEVAPSPYLRTVGVAYDHDRTGIVAVLLGRLNTAPDSFRSIRVYAFRRNVIVAQANLQI